MNQRFRILAVFALMLFFTSCANSEATSVVSTPKDSSFIALIPNCEMSGMVEFTLHPAELSIEELVSLGVGNLSKERLLFPPDYNVRIYSYDEGTQSWLDVVNDAHYTSSSGDLLQPAGSGLASYAALVINPIVVTSTPTIIRIVISGNVINDNQEIGDCVGTFTEITIVP